MAKPVRATDRPRATGPVRAASPVGAASPAGAASPVRRPRADAERNRTRLLDTARAAFASGPEPVALEQIARDAGVGIGTLYRHFPTREALVEALYRQELADLCASAGALLATHTPERALRAWMDRFAGYVAVKREMADALRAVYASGAVTVPQARGELAVAVRAILDAGAADGTLRDDVRAEDVVTMVVGIFTATSTAGGSEHPGRMFDLLIDAVRHPGTTPRETAPEG
ncbi:MAG TPA: helix-turn-helix domain-containing protein [Trebonia sp.]